MVSKLGHCLADLLWRWRSGELAFDIACVVSNHDDLRQMVEREGLKFRRIPVDAQTRESAFAQIGEIFHRIQPDLIVLARYMQILGPDFVAQYLLRMINIHHSFLPAFTGGKPYHQAFERGVKLIGATSHYVTATLDEGPIIEQDVVRVSHRDTVDDMLSKGRDLEKVVLSRAVRWHLENRVLVYQNKTVVFV
jgi:formyltetrahydrofolate deformylase